MQASARFDEALTAEHGWRLGLTERALKQSLQVRQHSPAEYLGRKICENLGAEKMLRSGNTGLASSVAPLCSMRARGWRSDCPCDCQELQDVLGSQCVKNLMPDAHGAGAADWQPAPQRSGPLASGHASGSINDIAMSRAQRLLEMVRRWTVSLRALFVQCNAACLHPR